MLDGLVKSSSIRPTWAYPWPIQVIHNISAHPVPQPASHEVHITTRNIDDRDAYYREECTKVF